jgi:glycosyltransferase involved in cell wall biosynthesis
MAGGGAERKTIRYLRYLNRERFRPLLYLISNEGELLREVPEDVPVFAFWQRNRFPRMNYPGRIHRMQVRDLANVLRDEHVDILCSITFLLNLVAAASVHRRPTPWLAFEAADPRLAFPLTAGRFRWIKRRMLSQAYRHDAIPVAVSAGVREGMQAFFDTPAERIAVLPNFIDIAEVDRLASLPGPCLDADQYHIVTVGRMQHQKGQIHLLNALHQLVHEQGMTSVRLHLLGQGPLEREFRAFVHSHDLDNHVVFAGFVANPFAYISNCDLFCFPSIYEGFPNALLEALTCKVPVISTDCPSGPREILEKGKYGRLVPPGNATALADTISEAIHQQPKMSNMATAARQHVEARYSVHVGIEQLERLLESALESK